MIFTYIKMQNYLRPAHHIYFQYLNLLYVLHHEECKSKPIRKSKIGLEHFLVEMKFQEIGTLARPETKAIILLDTNVLLDFIEGRDKETRDFVKKLTKEADKGKIELGTTALNISEVIDKELELSFQLMLLKKKRTADYIIRTTNNRRELARIIGEFNEKDGFYSTILKKLDKINKIKVFYANCYVNEDFEEMLRELILKGHLRSQDAFIVAMVYLISTSYQDAFFLTTDRYLVESKVVDKYVKTFNPREEKYRIELLNFIKKLS